MSRRNEGARQTSNLTPQRAAFPSKAWGRFVISAGHCRELIIRLWCLPSSLNYKSTLFTSNTTKTKIYAVRSKSNSSLMISTRSFISSSEQNLLPVTDLTLNRPSYSKNENDAAGSVDLMLNSISSTTSVSFPDEGRNDSRMPRRVRSPRDPNVGAALLMKGVISNSGTAAMALKASARVRYALSERWEFQSLNQPSPRMSQ